MNVAVCVCVCVCVCVRLSGLSPEDALSVLQSMGSPLPANSQLVGADSVSVRPPEPGSCPWPVYRCNVDQKYRSWDGSCNNLADPIRGRSFTPLARYLPPQYADGTSMHCTAHISAQAVFFLIARTQDATGQRSH